MSSSPHFSWAAYCREGISVVFRNAVLGHARVVFRAAYPATWKDELRRLYGASWSQIEESPQRMQATGARDKAPVDYFDLLGVEHFDVLISSHFALFFPESSTWTPRVRKAALAATQRWLKVITDARHVTAHPTTDDLSVHNVLEPLWAARHVLRCMNEIEPSAEIDRLIAHVFRAARADAYLEPDLRSAKASGTTETLTFDEWMLAGTELPPDDLYLGLIRFFQDLADFHEVEGREFRAEHGEGPWSIDRGPQAIALAIQDWWLGLPDEQVWEVTEDDDGRAEPDAPDGV